MRKIISLFLLIWAFSEASVSKWVEEYGEVLWLADARVRKTEEGEATAKGSYSEQLFGQKFAEFDRTVMTLKCLDWILDGSETAYHEFTAAQSQDVRLSKESFTKLHLQGVSLLKSQYGGLSESEMAEAMKVALVLGDVGKSEKAREFFKIYGAKAPDHDDFHEEVMKILRDHPELSPSFARLPSSSKQLLCQGANLIHYGHVTHLEGGPSMFLKLKQSGVSANYPVALAFDLFVHTCDVAGALGHVNNQSSLVYTEKTHLAMQAMADVCKMLADSSEWDAYNAYLTTRAHWLGLNSEDRIDRALARIGAMLRLFTPEEGAFLRKAMLKLDPSERARVVAQLDVQKGESFGRTPTYIPAVLVNLSNNNQLGSTKEERITEAAVVGLPFITRVLEKHKELLAKEAADPNIPLNFNTIAAVAKKFPNLLFREGDIDKEGNIGIGIDAVIFDCDGVLVDTEYLKFEAWREALASQGIEFTIEEYMPLVGHSSANILQMISKLKGVNISEEVVTKRNVKYQILQRQGVQPIQAVVEYAYMLSQKRKPGLKLGLASSAPREEILVNLRQIGLEDAFDIIVSGTDDLDGYTDVGGKNKPKPYIYIEASKRLNVSPSRCLVLEDTAVGVEAAVGAGMIAVAVPNRFTVRQDFSKASCHIAGNENLQQSLNFFTEVR